MLVHYLVGWLAVSGGCSMSVPVSQQSALLYHRRKILSAALERWKTRRQSRVLARQHSMSAWQHASHKMMRSAWAAWVKVRVTVLLLALYMCISWCVHTARYIVRA